MKNISIALIACLLMIFQFSCKEKEVTPPADTTPTAILLAEEGRSPAWSPDGKTIAYIYEESLYLMNSDGSNKHKLESDLYEYPAIWSPSGGYMLYTGHSPSTGWELIRIDANGDNKTILCGNTTNPHHASWSPDGQKIAFTTWNSTLSIMNSDGTNMHTLTEDVNTYQTPRWTPDMTTLMFTWGFDYDRDIYFINCDGSNRIRLATDSLSLTNVHFFKDGTKVLFSGSKWLTGPSIYFVNYDGTGLHHLTDGGGQILSPDGTKIVFTSHRDSESALYIMDSDGSGQQRLIGADIIGGKSLSPDGKEIAFTGTLNDKSGIYSIRIDQ